jgi:signal peptidase
VNSAMAALQNLMKMKGILLTLLVVAVVVVGGTAASRAISGTNLPFAAVQSGSMEPTIPTGSLLFIQYVSGEDIVAGAAPVGDVVIYRPPAAYETMNDYFFFTVYNPTPISHRAIMKTQINGTYYFLTKGDNNAGPDQWPGVPSSWVPETRIIGKVVFFIPYAGYPFLWFKNPMVVAGAILILIILIIIPIGEKKEGNKFEEKSSENKKAL